MIILVMASFIIAGLFAYKQLPVAAIPRVDFPTIQVTAQLPGASPETMAASVASILERQFSTIAGVTAMTSTSSLGNTAIVLQFDLNRNIDGAALDVQSAISSAMLRGSRSGVGCGAAGSVIKTPGNSGGKATLERLKERPAKFVIRK